ncbi:NADH-quinone oxidoreductase subunit L [Pseudoduganella ginsengisoli]|uniref:Probable inorganic carbon transporter subunit DabB n=1 Tax=Pseudoduganella ginsengisoli TaxID=1462440 RepID=A0A6L6Q222_9BURK|nr:NADH-quinone oxidoreductase subunit L [Pseudoduganella ginsengisoli]MTW03464.1 NADH-quinone oxidoreductase subunit L [Pseudoduganella ginsengisoli]
MSTVISFFLTACALAPALLMAGVAVAGRIARISEQQLWRALQAACGAAVMAAVIAAAVAPHGLALPPGLLASPPSQAMTLLVQMLGAVIAAFSARYLQGERGQRRYVSALAGVLASVHVLLLADHWLVLIAAWSLVGAALQPLLCFYPDRPFALLAARKKLLADRAADGLLVSAALLAWSETGSGSLSALWAHVSQHGMGTPLHVCAAVLALAVILRTAQLPAHGWLIQVMEAPTPVSALLHAGVVNLGGFMLIRFAPLLQAAVPARALLLAFGLATAVLAGMVMLTRVSIKVRLAWSTVAQMGFMLVECAAGLYTLAALHLAGHSLYKAHVFLSASATVRQTRQQALHGAAPIAPWSLALAPLLAMAVTLPAATWPGHAAWPWWWGCVLGLAWAPLLWLPGQSAGLPARARHAASGVLMVAGLTAITWLGHRLPLGGGDAPDGVLGMAALAGMAGLYLCLAVLQWRPHALPAWRRWSYAGFYVDEAYTRLALAVGAARWTPVPDTGGRPSPSLPALTPARQ